MKLTHYNAINAFLGEIMGAYERELENFKFCWEYKGMTSYQQ